MSEYVKIRKKILTDIADAIRDHKDTSKLYNPSEFAMLISSLFTLPSAMGKSTIESGSFEANCIGELCVIHAASAMSIIAGSSFISNAQGCLVEE